jgi:hypothetical protein
MIGNSIRDGAGYVGFLLEELGRLQKATRYTDSQPLTTL